MLRRLILQSLECIWVTSGNTLHFTELSALLFWLWFSSFSFPSEASISWLICGCWSLSTYFVHCLICGNTEHNRRGLQGRNGRYRASRRYIHQWAHWDRGKCMTFGGGYWCWLDVVQANIKPTLVLGLGLGSVDDRGVNVVICAYGFGLNLVLFWVGRECDRCWCGAGDGKWHMRMLFFVIYVCGDEYRKSWPFLGAVYWLWMSSRAPSSCSWHQLG